MEFKLIKQEKVDNIMVDARDLRTGNKEYWVRQKNFQSLCLIIIQFQEEISYFISHTCHFSFI